MKGKFKKQFFFSSADCVRFIRHASEKNTFKNFVFGSFIKTSPSIRRNNFQKEENNNQNEF